MQLRIGYLFVESFCAAVLRRRITSLIRPSVRTPNSITKRCRKSKIGVNVLQSRSNWCVNFQFRRSTLGQG